MTLLPVRPVAPKIRTRGLLWFCFSIGMLVFSSRDRISVRPASIASYSFARNIRSLVQGNSSGGAMDRFAQAPFMPSDIEGYGVAVQMARRIDRMGVAAE